MCLLSAGLSPFINDSQRERERDRELFVRMIQVVHLWQHLEGDRGMLTLTYLYMGCSHLWQQENTFPTLRCRSVHLWCIGWRWRVLALTYLCMLSWSPTAKVVLICDSKKRFTASSPYPHHCICDSRKVWNCLPLSWWVTAKRRGTTDPAWVIFLSHILTKSKHSEINSWCMASLLLPSPYYTHMSRTCRN